MHRRSSLRRLLADAIEDQFSLNAAFPRTLKTLLLKPGLLTQEYLRGRIASYIPPFRLYLIASFLFFLNIALFGCDEDDSSNVDYFTTPDSATVAGGTALSGPRVVVSATRDSVAARRRREPVDSAATAQQREQIVAQIDTFFAQVNLPFEAVVQRRVTVRALALHAIQGDQLNRIFVRELQARLPVAIFLMIPVFTAIIKLLYIRQRRFYVEHFVYAMHVHSFAFLTFTFTVWLQRWGLLVGALWVWVIVYIMLSMRRVYAQSWWVTLPKFLILAFTHMMLTGLALAGIVVFMFFFAPV